MGNALLEKVRNPKYHFLILLSPSPPTLHPFSLNYSPPPSPPPPPRISSSLLELGVRIKVGMVDRVDGEIIMIMLGKSRVEWTNLNTPIEY